MIGRRNFITLLGGATVAWPLAAGAQQQGERVRRIGVLTYSKARFAAFQQRLGLLGWNDRRNTRIEYRWAAGDPDDLRK